MQKRIYSLKYLIISRLISLLISPYYGFLNLFRKNLSLDNITIKKILITEYHRIGDLIIIAPILKSIKKTYPDAKLILLCNNLAEQLAKQLNLADEIISTSAPWTDWSFSLYKWREVRKLAKKLEKKKIDLAFDFKGDLRNSWFLWKTNPKKSFGYFTTGGSYFLTDSFKMNQKLHQLTRSEKLIQKAGCGKIVIEKNNVLNKSGKIVFHTGATDSRRMWPDLHWLKLAKQLSINYQISIVKTNESIELINKIKNSQLNIEIFEGNLIEVMNWIKNQQCLIALDSMAGHLASYVGIPVVSIFGSQNPNLTKPTNKFGVVIKPAEPCNHFRNHWRFCKECVASIKPDMVNKVLLNHLSQLNSLY